jgi:hypothetical protein
MCPFDAIKVRMQMEERNILRNIAAEGTRSLWRNYPSRFMLDCSFLTTYVTAYETFRRWWLVYEERRLDEQLPFHMSFSLGGLGGCIGWVVACPCDRLNSRLQLKGAKGSFGIWFSELKQMIAEEGIRRSYDGWALRAARGFVGYGAFTFGLESMRDLLSEYS